MKNFLSTYSMINVSICTYLYARICSHSLHRFSPPFDQAIKQTFLYFPTSRRPIEW